MKQKNSILIDFPNSQVAVCASSSEFEPLLEWLQDDFRSFKNCLKINPKSQRLLEIEISPLPALKPRPLWFYRPGLKVFGWGRRKLYANSAGCRLEVDFSSTRTAKIEGPSCELIYEMLYLFILSTAGEWLERDGWIRLHGLSFVFCGASYVLVGPPGIGKSALAAQADTVLTNTLPLGDEVCLIKEDALLSFPLRLALDSKTRASIGAAATGRFTYAAGLAHKEVLAKTLPRPQILRWDKVLVVTSRGQSWKKLSPLDLRSYLQILVGLGLPQMLEYILRFDNLWRLATTLWRRSQFFWKNWQSGKIQSIQSGWPELSQLEFFLRHNTQPEGTAREQKKDFETQGPQSPKTFEAGL